MKKLIKPKSSFRAYYAEQPQGNCSSFNFSKSLGRAVFEVLIYSSFPETINNKDPTLIWKASQSWEEQPGNALACCTFVHKKPLSPKDNREEELCFKVVIYHPSLWDTWAALPTVSSGPYKLPKPPDHSHRWTSGPSDLKQSDRKIWVAPGTPTSFSHPELERPRKRLLVHFILLQEAPKHRAISLAWLLLQRAHNQKSIITNSL